MSRFAADPKWLIYLPPTMSPTESSSLESFLEHPTEAFDYFRRNGVQKVICEQKHMGSRAVVVLCRNEQAAQTRFGIDNSEGGSIGIVYSRTGRRFFNDHQLERAALKRVAAAMQISGFWESLNTDWVCLDCELMPWSAKAQDLLKNQYAAVGAATKQSLPAVIKALKQANQRLLKLDPSETSEANAKIELLLQRFNVTQSNASKFVDAYRQYCWKVNSLDDLKLAPFHILATEGAVHVDQNHLWHMAEIEKFCAADVAVSGSKESSLLMATEFREVDLGEENSVQSGIDWWMNLTDAGGEGMVVKPLEFITKGKKGLNQPAVKCRGREYLRIIYGPDYDTEKNLQRLRNRHLGRKRSLAIREFALGVESLERFVTHQPLRKVHECVFGVLAMESEPVDPRL